MLLLAKALREARAWRAGSETLARWATPLAEVKGAAFEGVRFRHPWIDRDSPGVLGDYVTLDTGTGVVHTAPGHGWDDYLTGVRYGLDIYCPVDEAGRFLPEVEHFAGKKVFDANPKVDRAPARERARCSGRARTTHSYPICWRCKNPIIFRATEQWFIGLDGDGFREQALDAIAEGALVPGLGRGAHPQHDRDPSRLVHLAPAALGRAHPRLLLQGLREPRCCTPELARRVADLFEAESADAWYEREAAGPAARRASPARSAAASEFDKEKDILDVWFDSGLLARRRARRARPDLPWPADVYLEGSDQHRGWFHSSLLIGVGTRGRAPYDQVITHGFTVDGRGPEDLEEHGQRRRHPEADRRPTAPRSCASGRSWSTTARTCASRDEMIKRVAEAYRKVRNTCRYLLSNLYDFDPAKDAVRRGAPRGARPLRAGTATARSWPACSRPTTTYEFHVVYHQLVQYCAADLSSFYLDVLKDRLYCDAPDGAAAPLRADRAPPDRARPRAAAWRPVLPFTADEVWPLLPGSRGRRSTWPSSPTRRRLDEAARALERAARGARRGDEGARRGARGQARSPPASRRAVEVARAPADARAPARARGAGPRRSPATWPTCSS